MAKMLTFVLPIEKRLAVSFWTFFQISRVGNQGELEKKGNHQKVFVDTGLSS